MLRILCFSSMISSLIYEGRIGISIPKKHCYRFISIMISFFNVIILQFHSRVIDIRLINPLLFHSLWSSIFLILISLRVAKKERSPDRCILIWIESLIHIHMIGKYFRVLMYPSFWWIEFTHLDLSLMRGLLTNWSQIKRILKIQINLT